VIRERSLPPDNLVAQMSQAKSLGRRPVVALAAGDLAGLLVIGTAGFAVMTSGTPSLADRFDTSSFKTTHWAV
jgi:hypothetical protein